MFGNGPDNKKYILNILISYKHTKNHLCILRYNADLNTVIEIVYVRAEKCIRKLNSIKSH